MSRAPSGARGLKHYCHKSRDQLPARRAPSGARGLKLKIQNECNEAAEVAPRPGRVD